MDDTGLDTILQNSLQFHMNESSTIVPDERDFIRTWRRRIRDVMKNEHHRFLHFLVADTHDLETVTRHNRLLRDLSDPFLNTNSEWLRTNTNPIINKDEVLDRIDHDIAMPLESLRNGLRNVMSAYNTTLHELFDTEQRLDTKLKEIERVHMWLKEMPENDTEESSALQTRLFDYMKSVYEQQNIQRDYIQFCTLFARFTALRSIQMPLQSMDTTSSPMCTICTSEKVTYTVIPCGHTFCNSCCHKQRWNCYICRTTIRDRQRIYFN
jgi:hypothetical protein